MRVARRCCFSAAMVAFTRAHAAGRKANAPWSIFEQFSRSTLVGLAVKSAEDAEPLSA